MKVKIHTTEQIIQKLREVERLQASGQSIAEACKQIAVSEHTFYKWRKRFGTMQESASQTLENRWSAIEGIRARERSTQETCCQSSLRHFDARRGGAKVLKTDGLPLSPQRKRRAAKSLQAKFKVSQRRACRVIGQGRSTHCYVAQTTDETHRLTTRVRELASRHPRFGYRRITALLGSEGWRVNRKRVHRIWRLEGLRVSIKQRKRRRMGSSDGAVTRRAATHEREIWSYDFVMDQTADGRRLKMLPIVDEYTRECLGVEVARHLTATDVVATLDRLFKQRGAPKFIRSDNGPEFVACAVKEWLAQEQVETSYIEPGSPWQNAYSESFNSRFRDELLDREVFTSLTEAQVLVEGYRHGYNTQRPHSSLGYQTPAAFVIAAQHQPPNSVSYIGL